MGPRLPTVIDLFCGPGGLALGFDAAGCRIQAAVDIDETAGETFNQLRGAPARRAPVVMASEDFDLEQMRVGDIPGGGTPPDIVIGGPPCQRFSIIGRAKIDSLGDEGFVGDPRNELYWAFVHAVDEWQPGAFVMENVPGILSVDGRNLAAAEWRVRGTRSDTRHWTPCGTGCLSTARASSLSGSAGI